MAQTPLRTNGKKFLTLPGEEGWATQVRNDRVGSSHTHGVLQLNTTLSTEGYRDHDGKVSLRDLE